MKTNPYYRRQKCRLVTLVSRNIRFMRIFVGVPQGRGRQTTLEVVDDGNFLCLGVATSSKTSEIRRAITITVYDDMLRLVGGN